MPVSLLDSRNALLQDLWIASLVLAAASLLVAMILVVRRLLHNRTVKRRQSRVVKIERILWGALGSSVLPTRESLPLLTVDDAAVICSLALDIIRPLRGEEAARVAGLLRVWGLYPYLHQSLCRGRQSQCIKMLTLLGHFRDEFSLELLKKWASNRDSYVQLAALRALAARNAIETLPEILLYLIHTKNHNTALLADVLVRFGEPAVTILIPLAKEAEQLEVQLAAIIALGAIGSLAAVPALINLAFDLKTDIRAQSISVLGRLSDQRAEYAIFQGLEDRESVVRLHSAQAAGRLRLQGATAALVKLLSDPSWWVRYRAAEALFRMGSAGQTLLELTSQQKDTAGDIAGQVLAEMASHG